VTELSFLIDLLLNHKLMKSTKDAIAERIKNLSSPAGNYNVPGIPQIAAIDPSGIPQAASTLAAMARHQARDPELLAGTKYGVNRDPSPVPLESIAQTPAAVQAVNNRQSAINEALSGKINKETGRPRKW
jgi:hypothetical protein